MTDPFGPNRVEDISRDNIHVQDVRYVVSAFPLGDPDHRYCRVFLEQPRRDRWVVSNGGQPGEVQFVDADGQWGFPGDCDDVATTYYHSRDRAEQLARDQAVIMGQVRLSARRARQDSLYTPAAGDADRFNELGQPRGYVHPSAG